MTKEYLTGKQIALLLFDRKTGAVKADGLASFTRDFYHHMAAANPANETNMERSLFDRRLDAMARLVVGDEVCAAIAFDGIEMQVATNRVGHGLERIYARVAGVVKKDSYAVDQYQIFPVLYLSTNACREEIRVVSNEPVTYYFSKSKKFQGLKLASGQTVERVIKLLPEQHLIPFAPDIDFSLHQTFNTQVPLSSYHHEGMSRDTTQEVELDTQYHFNIPYNALQRRVESLIKYMAAVIVTSINTDPTKTEKLVGILDNFREKLLTNTLTWQAAKWYKEYDPFPRQYVDSSKAKLDEFVGRLNADFVEFRKTNSDVKGTISLLERWVDSIMQRIASGAFVAPEYVKVHIGKRDGVEDFFFKAKQYFIDLEKLDSFVRHEYEIKTAFSKWLLTYGAPYSQTERVTRIVDLLPEGVHAEVRILYYYLQKGALPSYIATSLLCCAQCKVLLDAYEVEGISGIHAKSFGNWHIPLEAFEEKDPEFFKKFLSDKVYDMYQNLDPSLQEQALKIIEAIANINEANLRAIGVTSHILSNSLSILARESVDISDNTSEESNTLVSSLSGQAEDVFQD